jgi:hypothetical protein
MAGTGAGTTAGVAFNAGVLGQDISAGSLGTAFASAFGGAIAGAALSAGWTELTTKKTAGEAAQHARTPKSMSGGSLVDDGPGRPPGTSLFDPEAGALACNGPCKGLTAEERRILQANIQAVSDAEWELTYALAGGTAAKWIWRLFKAWQAGRATAAAARAVPLLRQEYVKAVEGLAAKIPAMRQAGMNSEQMARALHAERRALGVQLKSVTPPDVLQQIYARNLAKYGDRLGPTIEYLVARGKTWEQIIESAVRTGGKDLGF